MNILLFSPPMVHPRLDRDTMQISPPLAIYHLGGILKDKGYNTAIYDPLDIKAYYADTWDEKSVEELISGVDVIGISTNSFNWGMAKEFIDIVKSRPNAPFIICGGVHTSLFHQHVMEVSKVDIVVREDGETALIRVLEDLENQGTLADIPNITYREKGKLKINPVRLEKSIPANSPDYHLIPDKHYYSLPVELSRGCPFDCIFCAILFIRSWRAMDVNTSLQRLDNSLKFLKDKTTANSVLFTDDCFTTNTQRAKEIFQALDRDERSYRIHFNSRVSDLLKDDELIKAIPGQKVSTIEMGIECGYDEGLKRVNKGMTLEDVENCLEKLKKQGIAKFGLLSFIVGFPWERYDDCVKTIEYAQSLEDRYGVITIVNWWMPLKSKLWDQQSECGFYIDKSVYDNPLWPTDEEVLNVVHPHISINAINKLMSKYGGLITHLLDMV
jgi:anaerobic magnesium-protoporphyrin IX monomethyl ester cyclase